LTTKIVFVGKPEMGKTTIKKVVFEGEDPNELVFFPLEATISQKFSVHEFMNSKIILLDTAGQSLSNLLEDEEKQIRSFENTNAIIYIFDYPSYIENSEEVINDIHRLHEINEKHKFNAKIILFLHKIDLMVAQKIGIKLALVGKQINKLLKLPEDLAIYFTSLHPNLIYTIYNALYGTIGDFSERISNLKKKIKELIQNLPKTICIVTNSEDNQVIQEISNDFSTSALYNLNEQVHKLIKSDEDIKAISFDTKIFHSIFENVSGITTDFNKVILLSETLDRIELGNMINDVKTFL
jgi:GTPase SAR1 family protein